MSPSQSSSSPLHSSEVGTTAPRQASVPPVRHTVVPYWHSPCGGSERPQSSPSSVGSSSTVPSQSLSRPSQTSGPPCMGPSHKSSPSTSTQQTSSPSLHSSVPLLQTPRSVPQGVPSSVGSSSVLPSQSSFWPLQISGNFGVPPTHVIVPLRQAVAPSVHRLPSLQALDTKPSSTRPSQSSSSPLQVSTPLWSSLPPMSVEQIVPPPKHSKVPSPHTPTPSHAPPTLKPSSTTPSQLLSEPSQTSTPGVPGVTLQASAPKTHSVAPFLKQMPAPTLQGTLISVRLLSVAPSQSSSKSLQTSMSLSVLSLQTGVPPTHSSMPSSQKSLSGPSQGPPTSVGLSSSRPLQSSSKPLHTSTIPASSSSQTMSPAIHSIEPSWHRSESVPSQATPVPGIPSSTVPSQSSSMPLHDSAEPLVFGRHRTVAPTHTVKPGMQAPCWAMPVSHVASLSQSQG